MRRRVTSQDVAEAAGVSRATVSFVLNDTPGQKISDATRQAVLDAANRLGYAPSAAARTLRSGGTSRLVLVLTPEWEPSAVMDEALVVLTRELREHGYATVIVRAAEDPASLDAVWLTVSPAAVVAMLRVPDEVRARIALMDVPLIEVLLHSPGGEDTFADAQHAAGRLQTARVISRGADRILYLRPSALREPEIADEREAGVKAEAVEHGVAVEVADVGPIGASLRDMVPPAIRSAARASGLLGVCAFNDDVGVSAIVAAQRMGLSVPDEVLVVGVDADAVGELVDPPLTSVRFAVLPHMRRIAAAVAGVDIGVDTAGMPAVVLVERWSG